MRKLLAVLGALAAAGACSGQRLRAPAPGDELAVSGALVDGARYGLTAADVAKLPRRTVRGLEPHVGKAAAFAGADLIPFLTERLPLKRGVDVVIFHGRGGYQAAVPLNAIRQSRPVLASEADGKPLEEWAPGLGSLLLAWPDEEAPGLDSDPRQRWFWVRGVTQIELAVWQESMGRALQVPPGASDQARHGADAFGSRCIHCHRLRGKGGEVGPDLTTYLSSGDPSRLGGPLKDHLAAKSGFRGTPELGATDVRDVGAFLRALAIAGADRSLEEPKVDETPRARPPPRQGPRGP